MPTRPKEREYDQRAWIALKNNPEVLEKHLTRNREWWRRNRLQKASRPYPDACEVCGRKHTHGKRLHWHHDHKTGKFVAWLCHQCNMGSGSAMDNPVILRRLAAINEGQYEGFFDLGTDE